MTLICIACRIALYRGSVPLPAHEKEPGYEANLPDLICSSLTFVVNVNGNEHNYSHLPVVKEDVHESLNNVDISTVCAPSWRRIA